MKNYDDDAEAALKSISKILYALKTHGSSNTYELASRSPLDHDRIKRYVRLLERKGFIRFGGPHYLATYSITSTGIVFGETLRG